MSDGAIWTVIVGLGLATYAIRFSFLGLIGDREPSPLVRTLLRYVPTAVLPALVAPLVVFPDATGGALDPARLIAAALALTVGMAARSVVGAIVAGMGSLWVLLALGV